MGIFDRIKAVTAVITDTLATIGEHTPQITIAPPGSPVQLTIYPHVSQVPAPTPGPMTPTERPEVPRPWWKR